MKKKLETHYQISIKLNALEAAVDLAERFIPERFFPDKALDLLDEASASLIPNYQPNLELDDLRQKLTSLAQNKIEAINRNDYQEARSLRQQEDFYQKRIFTLNDLNQPKSKTTLSSENVAEVVSFKTGVSLNETQKNKLNFIPKNILAILKTKIIGQEAALSQLANSLKIANFRSNSGTLGAFILIGPTGVGKTETARILAKEVFGSEKSLIRLDMSEYSERHSISNLIGAPAGYIGYDEGGKLAQAVRQKPYSLVLFDEIEKAHPDIFNILLQILDNGYLTDNIGRKISFKNTCIILTSNLGNENLDLLNSKIGFHLEETSSKSEKEIQKHYKNEIANFFSQEMLARFTSIITYQPLDIKTVKSLIKKELNNVISEMRTSGIKLTIQPEIIPFLVERYDTQEGARSIKKLIDTRIVQPVFEKFDYEENNLNCCLKVQDNKITIEKDQKNII